MFQEQPILIVEDELLVAMEIAYTVAELDGLVVGPFATVAEALRTLEGQPIAGAILDAQLEDRDITPVALRLADAGVPLVVYTGTGLPYEVAVSCPHLPVVRKPVPARVVIERLCEEMKKLGRLPD